jgi:hypothetical protein
MLNTILNDTYEIQLSEQRTDCVVGPRRADLDMNTCLRNEKPAINRLSNGVFKHPTYLQQAHKDTRN